MISRHFVQLRFRRWRHQVLKRLSSRYQQGSGFIEKNGFARFSRLHAVWRPLTLWLVGALVLLAGLLVQIDHLKTYYQLYQPVPGGRFGEGLVGTFTTANPLYAVNDVDTAVSRLLFAGLLQYDQHDHLVGNLAESWSVDPAGRVYTVRLRPNLRWQDGQPLTSDDVVYTYHTIQDIDAQSPLRPSWQGVKVSAVDTRVITFTLPNPLSSFPYSLTNGIVPQHLLGTINPINLRSTSFNTVDPVGAGPFKWSTIGLSGSDDTLEVQISLVPFNDYWNGAPKLTSFAVHAYASSGQLSQAYASHQLTAMADADTLPASLLHLSDTHQYSLPMAAGVYTFFRTTSGVLADTAVRQALALSTDRQAALQTLPYPAQIVDEPLLTTQLGYDPADRQATGDPITARAMLQAAGWQIGEGGIRIKNGQRLAFTLTVGDRAEYRAVAHVLVHSWRAVGVDVRIVVLPLTDFQGQLSAHGYDAILYGISIGADPDVFVYWDSSQNDPRSLTRFNFSEYTSTAADASLEAGRTRLDPALRAVKYRAFLQAWQHDAPAVGVYQPHFTYVSHMPIYGLSDDTLINAGADRFYNVQNWMIERGWVTPK